jgi:hypothetical protein
MMTGKSYSQITMINETRTSRQMDDGMVGDYKFDI